MRKMAPKGGMGSCDPSARPLCFCGSVPSHCRGVELFKQMAKIICVAEISVHFCFKPVSWYSASDAFFPARQWREPLCLPRSSFIASPVDFFSIFWSRTCTGADIFGWWIHPMAMGFCGIQWNGTLLGCAKWLWKLLACILCVCVREGKDSNLTCNAEAEFHQNHYPKLFFFDIFMEFKKGYFTDQLLNMNPYS